MPPEQSEKFIKDISSFKKKDATLALIKKMVEGEVSVSLVRYLVPIVQKIQKDSDTQQSDDLIDILARIIDGNSRGKTMSEEEQKKLQLDFHEVCGTVDNDESSNSAI